MKGCNHATNKSSPYAIGDAMHSTVQPTKYYVQGKEEEETGRNKGRGMGIVVVGAVQKVK
jgi:hypothetical protein